MLKRYDRHKLAPISGSVDKDDASPLAAAIREVKEETTLDLTSIELIRKGKPYSFVDHDIGREWTINPFAFRLKSIEEGGKGQAGVTIDWEHEGWEWHAPLGINDSYEFEMVPKLVNSLRRVWPEYDLGAEAGASLTDGLRALQIDHKSGARQIAGKAICVLKEVIQKMDSVKVNSDIWWANVRMTVWHLCHNGRESMAAAITSSLLSVLDRLDYARTAAGSETECTQQIVETIDEFLAQRNTAVQRIKDSFVDHVRTEILGQKHAGRLSILTISYSSTILECLLEAAVSLNLVLDLRILESRPLCEGVTLASKLLQSSNRQRRIHVTLYSDASAAIAAKYIDLLLIGADRISSAGDVSNKTGTLPAVLSARHISPHAKVVVLSEVEKIAGPGTVEEHTIEENAPGELSTVWQRCVEGYDTIKDYSRASHEDPSQAGAVVRNVYFEWTPADFIGAYITDAGVWSASDIRGRSDWIGSEARRTFDSL